MWRSLLMFLVLFGGVVAAPLAAQQQSPPPDRKEQKAEKKAPPGDATQPPIKVENAKPAEEAKPETAKPSSGKADPNQPAAAKTEPTAPATAKPAEPVTDPAFPGVQSLPSTAKPAEDVTAPPLELDKGPKPIEYSLNPAKAEKEVVVGDYYMKKGNWSAATTRFEEAVKWNPRYSLGYLRLGEAREKKGELAKSIEAYRKYLQLDPNSKKRKDVEKSMARLERELKD